MVVHLWAKDEQTRAKIIAVETSGDIMIYEIMIRMLESTWLEVLKVKKTTRIYVNSLKDILKSLKERRIWAMYQQKLRCLLDGEFLYLRVLLEIEFLSNVNIPISHKFILTSDWS